MTDVTAVSAAEDQKRVDGLVELLDLERIEENIFRGTSPRTSSQRVFGGQVAGQALVAAGRTVPDDRPVHSLHSYFVRAGDPSVPIVYEVDRVRDGRSFSIRRVVGIQHGVVIFSFSASFQLIQLGLDHQSDMPPTPPPEQVPTMAQQLVDYPEVARLRDGSTPVEVRYVDQPPWARTGEPSEGVTRRWMRVPGRLPDDPMLHACVLTFASDLTLIDAPLARHGIAPDPGKLQIASLDHAVWFERPFRADEWFLYVTSSPSASGGRGLASGRFFTREGIQIASVVQEGLIRVVGEHARPSAEDPPL